MQHPKINDPHLGKKMILRGAIRDLPMDVLMTELAEAMKEKVSSAKPKEPPRSWPLKPASQSEPVFDGEQLVTLLRGLMNKLDRDRRIVLLVELVLPLAGSDSHQSLLARLMGALGPSKQVAFLAEEVGKLDAASFKELMAKVMAKNAEALVGSLLDEAVFAAFSEALEGYLGKLQEERDAVLKGLLQGLLRALRRIEKPDLHAILAKEGLLEVDANAYPFRHDAPELVRRLRLDRLGGEAVEGLFAYLGGFLPESGRNRAVEALQRA